MEFVQPKNTKKKIHLYNVHFNTKLCNHCRLWYLSHHSPSCIMRGYTYLNYPSQMKNTKTTVRLFHPKMSLEVFLVKGQLTSLYLFRPHLTTLAFLGVFLLFIVISRRGERINWFTFLFFVFVFVNKVYYS